MKKILLLLVFGLFLLSSQAQTQTQLENQVNQLQQKVDSLDHELSYLQLSFKLESFKTELTLFSHDLSILVLEIKANSYNGKLSYSTGELYKENYELQLLKKKAFDNYLKSIKGFFAEKIMSNSYTQTELEALFSDLNVIEKSFDSLDYALKLLKATLKDYTR